MSLRILLATHGPADPCTAVYLAIAQPAEHLRRKGHHVDVWTAADLRHIGSPRLDPLLLPPALAAKRIGAYDAAVFHSYLGWAFHLARPWLDPAHRVCTITSFHGLEPLYFQALAEELARENRRLSARFRALHGMLLPRLLKRSCQRSDAVFCLNSREALYLQVNGWADSDRIHRLANGVESECFMTHARGPAARRLLFVGQWLPAKGIRYLVEAFASLSPRYDVELSCVGTGAAADVVLASFPEPARDRVTVLPRVDRLGLQSELARADLFVFPSLSEGFSKALLEAMAAALPIVATNAGAAADLLKDGVNALVVAPCDAAALRTRIERLLGDAALRDRLGRGAHEVARAYTIDRINGQFADRLLEVVDRRARSLQGVSVRSSNVAS